MNNNISKYILTSRSEIAVLVSGISSMGLEILAGRMIAPAYGNSVYTWGTIIGVFLTALAIGYQRGGTKAANDASYRKMGGFLLIAAAYTTVVMFTYEDIINISTLIPIPIRYGSIIPVSVLFGIPTYYLGFISPYSAELSEKSEKGHAAGHIYAVGTFGSILGSFAATFVLIPYLSIMQAGVVLGGFLILAAIYTLSPNISQQNKTKLIFISCILISSLVVGQTSIVETRGETVYQTQSAYQEIEVIDNGDIRTMYLNGGANSRMDLNNPQRHVFNYTKGVYIPFLLNQDIDNALVIGGGGFTAPKTLARQSNVSVDVVEIDKKVVSTAKTYFNVSESKNIDIHVQDGRQYLSSTDTKYDIIMLDAYRKTSIPPHLTTKEFMSLTKNSLTEDGVVVANIVSATTGQASKFYKSEYKTMNTVYPQTYSFPTVDTNNVQNIILVSTKDSKKVTKEELLRAHRKKELPVNFKTMLTNYKSNVPTENAILLRDNEAPVDRLMSPLLGKRYVIEETAA